MSTSGLLEDEDLITISGRSRSSWPDTNQKICFIDNISCWNEWKPKLEGRRRSADLRLIIKMLVSRFQMRLCFSLLLFWFTDVKVEGHEGWDPEGWRFWFCFWSSSSWPSMQCCRSSTTTTSHLLLWTNCLVTQNSDERTGTWRTTWMLSAVAMATRWITTTWLHDFIQVFLKFCS